MSGAIIVLPHGGAQALYDTVNRQAAEIERLTRCLATANSNHEEYERRYYLTIDERDSARAECARLHREVDHAQQEETTMRDVLRAEHQACQRMRPVYEAVWYAGYLARYIATDEEP